MRQDIYKDIRSQCVRIMDGCDRTSKTIKKYLDTPRYKAIEGPERVYSVMSQVQVQMQVNSQALVHLQNLLDEIRILEKVGLDKE